ncbi:hydrolase [Gordonia phage Hexbug]|nr:hydrolase [Gordonia phage Hexbug]
MSTALSTLFKPFDGTGPTPNYDAYHNDIAPGDWTGGYVLERWDSAGFNKQGQNLVGITSDPNDGCINFTAGRLTPQFQSVGSVMDLEFMFTGDKFDIVMADPGGTYDTQVYIAESGEPMRKLTDLPKQGTTRGGAQNKIYRRIRLNGRRERRIRIILPLGIFHGILREKRDVVAPSPDRPLMLVTGDSYVESIGSQNAGSARTFHTYGIMEAIIEATGFAIARLGQGGTGYFNNASGQVSAINDYGPYFSSAFFSAHRCYNLSAFLGSGPKPVALLVNGTINDGELSGSGSGVADASAMQARVTAGWDWVRGTDDKVGIIQVSPEPYNNQMANPNGPHMVNRQGQKAAAAAHPSCIGYVDACDPAAPFFSGTGYEGSPADSSQAAGTGADQIHGNWYGYNHYGKRIVAAIGSMRVNDDRAQRIA